MEGMMGRVLDVDALLQAVLTIAPEGAVATYEIGRPFGRVLSLRWRTDEGDKVRELRHIIDQYVRYPPLDPIGDILGGVRNAILKEFPPAQAKPGAREVEIDGSKD